MANGQDQKTGYDKVTRQTLWISGEVGNRLTAIREDPIYQTSCKEIHNMIPTELGNLELMKKYTSLGGATTNMISPIKVLESKYGFDFVVCVDGLVTIDQNTHDQLFYKVYESGSINKAINVNIIENFIFVCGGIYTDIYEINTGTGEVSLSNFKDSMLLPLKFQEFITVDLYQNREYTSGNIIPFLVRTVDNPLLEYKDLGGGDGFGLYVGDTEYRITRVYTDYQADLISEEIPNLVTGEWIMIIHSYVSNTESSFVLDNTAFTFTGRQEDISGEFYTTVDLTAYTRGALHYGKLLDIRDVMIDAIEYENRVAILTEDYIFFSKVDDYNNFRNGVLVTDAFYFRPTPIGGANPIFLKFLVGQGLYTISNRGIYVAGYNQGLSPTNLTNLIISESSPTYEAFELDKSIYFIDIDGNLKAVQETSQVTGVIDFKTFDVEKFAVKQKFVQLDQIKIKSKDYIIATDEDGTNFFYWNRELNSFARVRIDLSDYTGIGNEFATRRNRIVVDGDYLELSDINVLEGWIVVNPPSVETMIKQSLICDYASQYMMMNLRILNQDNEAVEDVYINKGQDDEFRFIKLGAASDGVFSVYQYNVKRQIIRDLSFHFVSKENDKKMELQATELYHSQRAL